MNGGAIFACIIQFICGFGCGAAFLGVSIYAKKSKKPMHFYSGTEVDPKSISDIPAYNLENSNMWMTYSVPYWLSGLCGIGGLFDSRFLTFALILIVAACTVGICWLVWRYHRIQNTYKSGDA